MHLSEALGAGIVANEGVDLSIVGEELLVETAELGVELVQHVPGERGELEVVSLANQGPLGFEGGGAFRSDDAEFGEKAAHAVDESGVVGDAGVAQAMDEQNRLLLLGFDGDESHAGSTRGFADGVGVVEVVFAGAALMSIGGDEPRIDDAGIVAESAQFARPMVSAGAGFHGDQCSGAIGEAL